MTQLNTAALIKQLIADIQAGALTDAHHKLPAEPELMAHYQVTRYTLRQALQSLSKMGYTYQAHGVGTFVRPQQADSIALAHHGGLTAEMARLGSKLTTTKAQAAPTTRAQADFQPSETTLAPDDPLIAVTRLRAKDGQPYLMEQSYYRQTIIKTIPEAALYGSLFNYCEAQRDIRIGWIDQVIMSEPLPQVAAEYLNLPVGAPCLVVQDETYLSTGELLAFSKQYYDYRQAKFFMVKKVH